MSNNNNKYLEDDDSSDDDSSAQHDIHEIVRSHTLSEVKAAIAKDRPRLIAAKDKQGCVPLHHAAMLDRHQVALFLVAKRADVNARDDDERTPLHYAAQNGLTEMCRFLLDFHANIKLRDTSCWTALHYAVFNNHFETATLLIKRGADLNPEDHKYGRTPLHLAAELGLHAIADMLIIRGASLSATGDSFYSKTPLHLACVNNHLQTVEILCKRGADVNVLSGLMDKSPLHISCEKGYTDIVRVLLENGGLINQCGITVNGTSPLHIAVEMGYYSLVELLIEWKADLEVEGKFGTVGTPLHHAARHNQIHMVRLLIDSGANKHAEDPNKHTPLHIACKYGNNEIAAMLIEDFADHTLKSLIGKRPVDLCPNLLHKEVLIIACRAADEAREAIAKEKRFRELVEEERAKKLKREEDERLAREAAERKCIADRRHEFVTKLSQVVNQSGEYAALVEIARSYPDQDINEVLQPFSGGNNKDIAGGATALTRAAYFGQTQLIGGLLHWPGLNINAQDDKGNSALHNAAMQGSQELIEELLCAGINFGIMNKEGKVAANFAPTSGLRELLRNPQTIKRRRKFQDQVMIDIFHRREEAIVTQSLTIKDVVHEVALMEASRNLDSFEVLADNQPQVISLPAVSSGKVSTSKSVSVKTKSKVVSLPPLPGAGPTPTKTSLIANNLVMGNLSPNSSLSITNHASFPPPACPPVSVSSTATALQNINNLLAGYGPVPEEFGGSRGDFFNLTYYNCTMYNQINEHGKLFTNVYSLQSSYPPTAFDSTEEWCNVKDFLWLLGFPHRIVGKSQLTSTVQDSYSNSFADDSKAADYEGMPSGVENENENANYYQQLGEYTVEKRSIVYNIAVAMDSLQKVFLTPTHLISTFDWGGRMTEEKSNIDELNVKEEDLPTSQEHKAALSLPKNLLHDDFVRLQLFSDYCLKFLKEYLRLYDTYSVDYYDYLNRKEKIEYYHTHIAYLRDHMYVDWKTSELLEKLLPLCDVLRHSYDIPTFTNLVNLVSKDKKEKKKKRRSFRLSKYSESPRSLDGDSVTDTDGEDDETLDMEQTFNDPLRSLWSELVINPPRAMRVAADAIYELAYGTSKQLETAYPIDTVRAHIWAHHGRLLLQQQVEEEIQRTVKIQQHDAVSARQKKHKKNPNNQTEFIPHVYADGMVDSETNSVTMTMPVSALQVWLQDLHLLEYESYFTNLGFKLLEDFEELNDQDCYRYFPFLKVGDSRRLAKHCEGLDEIVIKKYKRKANKRSSVPLLDNIVES